MLPLYLHATLIKRQSEQSLGLLKKQWFLGYRLVFFMLRRRVGRFSETKIAYWCCAFVIQHSSTLVAVCSVQWGDYFWISIWKRCARCRFWCSLKYSTITSTESPSFSMTTFSASLTILTVVLPQSHDCSCYVSRTVLAPPPLWLQKHTLIYAHTTPRTLPGCDTCLGSLKSPAPAAGDFVELILLL
jgi:hypothetical protein